jgi:ribosomal protein S18 acetylase RimI-like enzyme
MNYALRKASSADWEFIWQLRIKTMKDYVSQSYGWDENVQRHYAEESLNGDIVVVDGKPAGVLTLSDWGDQLHLTWMAILPEYQGKGLGSQLINYCQQQADQAGKTLTLQVLRNNPAALLYKRHGFEIYAQNDPHKLLMRWSSHHDI